MSTKKERLTGVFGDNIKANAGVGMTPRLLYNPTIPEATGADRHQGVVRSKEAADIPLDRIVPDPDQPRVEFDEESLTRLAESLKTRGQLQPIRVRWDEGRGVYVIICGERRWRAAGMAGMSMISCMIHDGPVDVLAIQLIENALREDLKPVEQARAFKALIDRNGWENQRLAAELSVTPMTVSRCLALLNLPAEVQDQVEQGELSPSSAYEVTKLADPAEQVAIARAIIDEGLTKSEVIDVVKAVKAKRPAPDRKPEPVAFDIGDCTVTVRWKKPSPLGATEALKQAAKLSKDRDQGRGQVA